MSEKAKEIKELQEKSDREFLAAWDEHCQRQAEKNQKVLPNFLKRIVHKTNPQPRRKG